MGNCHRAIWVQQAVVHKHEKGTQGVATGHYAHHHHSIEVRDAWATIQVPRSSERHILGQYYKAVEKQAATCGSLSHAEPTEHIHDTHHHVINDLLPLGHAEVSLTLDDPKSHGTPVGHDEDPKVELEDWGKQRKRHSTCPNHEQMPKHLHNCCFVRHGQLVITRVPQGLLVGCHHPGKRHQRGWSGQAWKREERK